MGESGFSALMLACINGDMTAARCLLDAGADPDVETPCLPHLETPFWTALCYTVLQANVALARLLLERGAHVEGGWKPSEDRCTLTPLQLAVATGSTEMVSLLLAHGANACLSTLDKVTNFSQFSFSIINWDLGLAVLLRSSSTWQSLRYSCSCCPWSTGNSS